MKKILCGFLLIFVFTTCFGSSVFSSKGFVEENYGLDNFSTGMGETGICSIFRNNFSVSNPALIGTVKQSNLCSKLIFGHNYFKDSDREYKDKIAYFPLTNVILPISKNTFFGFNFLEKYHLEFETTQDSTSEIGDVLYEKKLNGSVNQLGFSFGKRIKTFLIGVNFNYNFGNDITEFNIDFYDSDLVDHFEENVKRFDCTNFSIGFAFPYSKFSFGGFYESKLKMSCNENYSIQSVSDTFYVSEIKFPTQIGLGIGFQISDNFYMESNYRHSFWKDINYPEMNERDSRFISFGLSYFPKTKFQISNFKFPIRIGGYYKQLPFKKDEYFVEERAVTFGFDIPLKIKNRGKLSLAFICGTRGKISKNGYEDEFIKLSIGFSSIDKWRNPKKYKKDKEIPKMDPKYRKFVE